MAAQKILVRVIFGTLLIGLVVGIVALDWWLYAADSGERWAFAMTWPALPIVVALSMLALAGMIEFIALARRAGAPPLRATACLGVVVVLLLVWLQRVQLGSGMGAIVLGELFNQPMIVLGGVVILAFAEQISRHRLDQPLRRLGATLLGVGYLGLGGSALLTLRLDYGPGLLVFFLAVVKFTDVGAYFTGTLMGRHKMIPWLSAGKSWEGLLGGIVFAVGVALAMRWALNSLFGPETILLPPAMAGVFGGLMALAGQFADLCESLLKRAADVKDSGRLVPEFGGILDMIDSPLLAAPIAVVLLKLMSFALI
jgi:phosphatidate cytidylyltransferase